jgi:hypothetical protein
MKIKFLTICDPKNIYITFAMFFITGCNDYSIVGQPEPSFNQVRYVENISITTQKTPESRREELISNTEGLILLLGWRNAESNEYDTSKLTKAERDILINDGVKTLLELYEAGDSQELRAQAAELLSRHYSLKQDYRKSAYWALKGAENGSSFCMWVLSDAYHLGNGVIKDDIERLKWMYLGAAAGNNMCKDWVNKNDSLWLELPGLRPIFIEAKKRAHVWMQEHPEAMLSLE